VGSKNILPGFINSDSPKLWGRLPHSKFRLTQTSTRFTLSTMDKQEIKGKLLEGIKSNRYINAFKSVAVFGSYVNGQPAVNSDVDVLVQFDENAEIGFFEYVRIQRHLSAAVGLKVDMVTPEALSKYIKPQVLKEAEVIYER